MPCSQGIGEPDPGGVKHGPLTTDCGFAGNDVPRGYGGRTGCQLTDRSGAGVARWQKSQAPEGHVESGDVAMRGTRGYILAPLGRARRIFCQLDAHDTRRKGRWCPGRPPVPRIRHMVAGKPMHHASASDGQPGGNLAPTMDGRGTLLTRAHHARLCRFRWFPSYGGNMGKEGGFNCCCTIQQLKPRHSCHLGEGMYGRTNVQSCELPEVLLQVESLQMCTDLKQHFRWSPAAGGQAGRERVWQGAGILWLGGATCGPQGTGQTGRCRCFAGTGTNGDTATSWT